MATWNSRGLRGSFLEEMINKTNDIYKQNNLALIQKIPTPITPININPNNKQITLAYFEKKSTVDYIGAVQGIPVCFDAKECKNDTFPMHNIHEHQVEFMQDFIKQEGIAFIIIYYVKHELYYYLSFEEILKYHERATKGGRKSIAYNELIDTHFFERKGNLLVPYLDMIQKELEEQL
ncbi:MAG: Holliday junction resolvase RecU [Lachnospiraceae bacterium]|nr:Holliday junction resolvase RecU [Lachnospiraceae bacterium]